jgi:hypothetical protein
VIISDNHSTGIAKIERRSRISGWVNRLGHGRTMRIIATNLARVAVIIGAVCTTKAYAVSFDLRGLTPNQSFNYSLSAAGISVQVGGSGFLLKSGPSTFGIDSNGANDDPMLIDGGNGSSESFSFLFGQDVFFESILISQFDAVDGGTLNIKGFVTIPLANGLNNVGTIAARSSAHFLRWTGDTVSGMGRGFSVDGFSVRLIGTVPVQPGDYNNNGLVDAADYIVWRKTQGNSITPFAGADGDGDGIVNAGDYSEWRDNFGEAAGSGSELTAVPEAPAMFLFSAGAAAALASCRRLDKRVRA